MGGGGALCKQTLHARASPHHHRRRRRLLQTFPLYYRCILPFSELSTGYFFLSSFLKLSASASGNHNLGTKGDKDAKIWKNSGVLKFTHSINRIYKILSPSLMFIGHASIKKKRRSRSSKRRGILKRCTHQAVFLLFPALGKRDTIELSNLAFTKKCRVPSEAALFKV